MGAVWGAEQVVRELREVCDAATGWPARVAEDMVAEMGAGLNVEGGSRVKMLLSYVDVLPTGNEEGVYYALDLGGTNFRVIRVLLGGKDRKVIETQMTKVAIPRHLMQSTTAELFGFIAAELAKFVATEGEEFHPRENRERELGFTFSFPVQQTSVASGSLLKWTKGFNIPDTVGKDVAAALHTAMRMESCDMRVAALINDTVGALAGGVYEYGDDVVAAVILGTGSNAAYVENPSTIPKLQAPTASDKTIINMEWGNFYSSNLPITEYDIGVDKESLNRGEQIFEKMISGMYLGDLVRRVLLKMAERSTCFGDDFDLENLKKKESLITHDMAIMHEDRVTEDLQAVSEVLERLYKITNTSLETRRMVVEVCDLIMKRSTMLASAGILGILKRLGRDGSASSGPPRRSVIAIDGGLYTRNKSYSQYLHDSLAELLGEEAAQLVSIETANDGSGLGAALIAASHTIYAAAN